MTVGYSARKAKEKEGPAKKKIGVGDLKKGKRGADSSDEYGTSTPPGTMSMRKAGSRFKDTGMQALSPQDRVSWDEKSCTSKSFQERTPTPESCRHSTSYRDTDKNFANVVQANLVRALVSANPPPHPNSFLPLNAHKGFDSAEAINGGFPTPGSMNISPEVDYVQPKNRTKREDSSDKESKYPPAAVKGSSSKPEKAATRDSGCGSSFVVSDRNVTPSDRGSSAKAPLKIPTHQQHHQHRHQLPPPGYKPHLMPDPAEIQAWMIAHYEANGCKGGCSRTSKGKRGKKSSSSASSSTARMGSEAVLRKKIEGALAAHLETAGDGKEGGESNITLKKMVDSVMSELSSSGIGTPRKEKRESKEAQRAESSSSLHTPRGMRSYPVTDPMGPQGWPCPPHPAYYGQWGPPPPGIPPPSKHSRPVFKASIPSPSSAFSSKTCGSGVSSSSFDSGSSRGNYFWPYTAQWYPPPWVSGYPGWGYYGNLPPGMPEAPPDDRMAPPGI
eukprot:TRINITY_DN8676_c3_g1_i1.p1 TRINITY_DN8676_c3_g1~~TRINITY_DN8676_c3_g1_i1.p1  ORF type:complete len:500 (+),score=94.43 TRINITY_DN8676_c3_g1_i1:39-1538(+)